MRERAFLLRHYRREHHELASRRPLHDLVDNILRSTTCDFFMANRAVRYANTRKKKTQIIINFSYRCNRRAWIARSRFLVNRNSRREASNHIDVWLIHHTEKHTSVARKRLDITALTFSINRIKSKTRFTGTRKTSNNNKFVARNIYVDVLQVIRARTTNTDFITIKIRTFHPGHSTIFILKSQSSI